MTPATPPPATRPHARLRAWLMRAGAVVLGLLAALAMLELGLRVALLRYAERIDRFRADFAHEWGGELSLVHFVRPSADTDRVYEMIPGAHGTFAGAPLRINPTGFRDADHPVEKPPGTRRVAVLGDSVAFGWGVPAEQRFSDVLARLLNDADTTTPTTTGTDDTATTGGTHATAASAPAWQVLNFAVPGYNSTMELATLRAVVMAHAPDAVVVSVIPNDDELPNFVRLEPEVWSLRRSFIAEAVRDRLVGRPIGDTARLAAGGVVEAGGAGHGQHVRGFRPELVPPEYRHLVGMDNARASLAGIARTCRAAGIPVLALFFSPHLGGGTDDDAPPRELVPWIAAARDAGMTLCDPSPALRRYLRQHGLTTNALRSAPDDLHPNARAHAIIARTLRETLREPLK